MKTRVRITMTVTQEYDIDPESAAYRGYDSDTVAGCLAQDIEGIDPAMGGDPIMFLEVAPSVTVVGENL